MFRFSFPVMIHLFFPTQSISRVVSVPYGPRRGNFGFRSNPAFGPRHAPS